MPALQLDYQKLEIAAQPEIASRLTARDKGLDATPLEFRAQCAKLGLRPEYTVVVAHPRATGVRHIPHLRVTFEIADPGKAAELARTQVKAIWPFTGAAVTLTFDGRTATARIPLPHGPVSPKEVEGAYAGSQLHVDLAFMRSPRASAPFSVDSTLPPLNLAHSPYAVA